MSGAPTFLVTGASGQVGHELVRELAPLGTVIAPTRRELDLADLASVREAVRRFAPRVIVNAGAYTAVDKAESERDLARTVNADAPRAMAEEASRIGAALVHYSTDYVFDGSSSKPYVETDATGPLSVYGETKLAGERGIAEAGGAWTVFRTSWVYGSRGHNFLRTMLRLAREREELRIVDDQIGAPTWSRSIAAATALWLARVSPSGDYARDLAPQSGVYHLTSGGETSWHGFAKAILALDPRAEEQKCRAVVAIPTTEFPTPATRPRRSVLDSTRLETRFGIRLPDWREQLALVMQGT